jgi:hypothetical protein
MWAVNVRLHDDSPRTWGPFAVAITLILALTWVPGTELWVGLVMVMLLVVELRLVNTSETVSPDA